MDRIGSAISLRLGSNSGSGSNVLDSREVVEQNVVEGSSPRAILIRKKVAAKTTLDF